MRTVDAMPYHTDFTKLINVKAFSLFPSFYPRVTAQPKETSEPVTSFNLRPLKGNFDDEKSPAWRGAYVSIFMFVLGGL